LFHLIPRIVSQVTRSWLPRLRRVQFLDISLEFAGQVHRHIISPNRGGAAFKGLRTLRGALPDLPSSSLWDPETFAPGRRHVPRGAPSPGSG
jgi:hypothetical protein